MLSKIYNSGGLYASKSQNQIQRLYTAGKGFSKTIASTYSLTRYYETRERSRGGFFRTYHFLLSSTRDHEFKSLLQKTAVCCNIVNNMLSWPSRRRFDNPKSNKYIKKKRFYLLSTFHSNPNRLF